MTELTVCMWLLANDGYSNEHVVSYAVDGHYLLSLRALYAIYALFAVRWFRLFCTPWPPLMLLWFNLWVSTGYLFRVMQPFAHKIC